MLATALLGGLLAAGWLVTPPTNAQIFGLSESQEVELGREAARQVEREQPILRDEQVIHYVNALGHRLARRSKRDDIPYRFTVVDSPDINAFALPGGFVYVNRELIEAADKWEPARWRDRPRDRACGGPSQCQTDRESRHGQCGPGDAGSGFRWQRWGSNRSGADWKPSRRQRGLHEV